MHYKTPSYSSPKPQQQQQAVATNNYTSERYLEEFRRSIDSPADYWAEAADNVVWTRKWDKVLDNSNPPFTKWFTGGEISLCYNAVDRHVDSGHGDQPAVIWDSTITGGKHTSSYRWVFQCTGILLFL